MPLGLSHGLRRAASHGGHNVALVDGARRFTWRELTDRIARLAGAFRNLGLAPGDRVALLAMNGYHSFETYYAALWAGGIIAPLNHRLTPAELAAQLADSAPAILVSGAEFAPAIPQLVCGLASLKAVLLVSGSTAMDGTLPYESVLSEAAPCTDAQRLGDDVAALFYTGGTTGAAKGVMLTHTNILANSVNFIAGTGVDERIVHLHCGPLFHVAAGVRLFSVTLLCGRHVMLPRFEPRAVLAAIEAERITLATFVPTMLRALLDEPDAGGFDLSSLRIITYGAAPMPEAMLRAVMARMPAVRFVQSYGMTETSPIITMLGAADHGTGVEGRLRSAGRAALLAEVAIVDPQGLPLPAGAQGEIVARGPMVMAGYWNNPRATAEALLNGWMHTGDIGYLDASGYLYVVDRLKDVIISGGENVYSQEVENAIAAHPDVAQCAVFGRPDPRWGEAVHAVVVPHPGRTLSAAAIQAHCKALIAGFKCPRSVHIRTTPLPLSGANKILKDALRAELLAREPA
jgi:long-chain acyl-CoA synthetase